MGLLEPFSIWTLWAPVSVSLSVAVLVTVPQLRRRLLIVLLISSGLLPLLSSLPLAPGKGFVPGLEFLGLNALLACAISIPLLLYAGPRFKRLLVEM